MKANTKTSFLFEKSLWVAGAAFLVSACAPFSPPEPVDQAPIVATDVAPEGMLLLQGNTFRMGPKDASIPVTVSSFYLDKNLVTVDKYIECIKKDACGAPLGDDANCNYNKMTKTAQFGRANDPINCVSFTQARNYCIWQKKRLPTEIEWEYAARGTSNSTYPWGNDEPSDQNVCINTKGTCKVGSKASTLFGKQTMNTIFDLSGNVWQWLDTQISSPLKATNQPCYSKCGLRGADSSISTPFFYESWYRENSGKIEENTSAFGFRCAKDQ